MRKTLPLLLLAVACGQEESRMELGGYSAMIVKRGPDLDEIDGWIWGDPLPDPNQCQAYINGAPIDSSFFWYNAGFVYMGVLYSGLGISPGTVCELHLEVGGAASTATENMPDTIVFLGSLGPGDTLAPGEDAPLVWSSDADFYDALVVVYLFSDAGDTMATRYMWDYLVDTSWLIPAESLRSEHPAWGWSEVWVDVDPVNGPRPSPGQTSNAVGELPGFFYAANYTGEAWVFYVGTPARPAGKGPQKEPRVPGSPWP